ncbi:MULTISPECIES: PDC sensor domain-containing protein [unclassified Fusibacter]|uniref:PDC sensor domain-containing protein n=1 Tax=unclassified Fusibacter TaxID=2624464 RepID=UPI0010113328|nr:MULTISPECIES: PDC sensor domain-containing protein [unclassified Fusibacter]MCK8060761.1 PDC sensor domain-containing protein [Fusibacter sp. A2]NPE23057.1 hypothetical protein [Fusibacter sp. A1]RXV59729.1 hypothetical protein DWB64_14540 [Fusibacter sp. A1]
MKRHFKVRHVFSFVLILALVMAGVACQKQLSAKETVERLYEESLNLDAYSAKFEGDMSMEFIGETDPMIEQYLGMFKNIKMSGDMQYKDTDRIGDYAMNYTLDMNGMSMAIEFYFDGSRMIVNYPLLPNYIVIDLPELLGMLNEEQEAPVELDYESIVQDLEALTSEFMPKLSGEIIKLIDENSLELLDEYTFTVDGESVTSKAVKVNLDTDLMIGMMNSLFEQAKNSEVVYQIVKKYDIDDEVGSFEDYQAGFDGLKASFEEEMNLSEFEEMMKNISYTYILGYDKNYRVNHMALDLTMKIDDESIGTEIEMTMGAVYAMNYDAKEIEFPELTDENSMSIMELFPDLSGYGSYEDGGDYEDYVPVNYFIEEQVLMLDDIAQDLTLLTETTEIEEVFESYVYDSYFEVMNLYYATSEGEMILYPNQELPDNYDPRERPWYTEALLQGTMIGELYEDAASGRFVQSISKTIVLDGEVIGVVGIDIFVD